MPTFARQMSYLSGERVMQSDVVLPPLSVELQTKCINRVRRLLEDSLVCDQTYRQKLQLKKKKKSTSSKSKLFHRSMTSVKSPLDEEMALKATALDSRFPIRFSQSFPGHVKECTEIMLSTTTEEFHQLYKYWNPDMINSRVLYVLPVTLLHNEIFCVATIKYVSIKVPVIADRELVYIDLTGLRIDENGDEVGFHAFQSIDLPTWKTPKHIVRCESQRIYILKKDQSDSMLIQATFLGFNDPKGAIPEWLSNGRDLGSYKERFYRLISICHPISARRIQKSKPQFSTKQKFCNLCQNRFKLSKSFCDLCGEWFCKSCVVDRIVFIEDNDKKFMSNIRQIHIKACGLCVRTTNHLDDEHLCSFVNHSVTSSVSSTTSSFSLNSTTNSLSNSFRC